eukprot:Rmarinus@m.1342
MPLTWRHENECVRLLQKSAMFQGCSEAELRKLTQRMTRHVYKKGDELVQQGETCDRLFVVAKGKVIRLRNFGDGQMHHIDTATCGNLVNSLHVVSRGAVYATARCADTVVAYELDYDSLTAELRDNPDLSIGVIGGLTFELRKRIKAVTTPLLEIKAKPTKRPAFLAVSVAAVIESFYRSAMNALLNAALTGQRGALFPNMHIQVPTRVVYINGFKLLRQWFDNNVDASNYSHPGAVRLGLAVLPGLCMTPVSSILEACNAAHANPEPLSRRWCRGLRPRCVREVIFGFGLNQLSDYYETRLHSFIDNEALRNAAGSMIAGVVAGYLSHIPHNMSTLKLMNPKKSYGTLFREYSRQSLDRVPTGIAPVHRPAIAKVISIIAPKGLLIRTVQIVGSFIILNGTIHTLKDW